MMISLYKSLLLLFPLLALLVAAQGELRTLRPTNPAPEYCSSSYPGLFTFNAVRAKPSGLRPIGNVCANPSKLATTLEDGVLLDSYGRIGSIVANRQFQYDGPPAQAGAVFTAGFSICPGNILTLGSQTVFWSCDSGNFANIYDRKIGYQCQPVYLAISNVIECE